MIEINLIPDVKREFLKTKQLRNYVISTSVLVGVGVIGLAVVLGLILGGMLVAEKLQDDGIDKEGKALTSIEDLNKTVTIQQQIEKINAQQAVKTIDSRLFDVMVAIDPPSPNNIKISELKLDPVAKTISVEGSAANGYSALEVVKKTIANTKILTLQNGEEVEVDLATDIVAGDTGFGENAEGQRVLRFSFSFTYSDELFAVSKDPVKLVTPKGKVDVTDSKLGVPSSLFEKRASDEKTDGGGN